MSDAIGGVALSPEENAFFESGGETAIPDTGVGGSDAGGGDGSPGGEGNKAPRSDNRSGEGDGPVPLAKFLEEKNRRKDLDKRLRDSETQLAEMRGKFSILDRLNKAPGDDPAQPVGPPKAEDDIFGAVNHVIKRLDDADKAKADSDKAKSDADKAEADRKVFVDNYQADFRAFEQKNPDYKAAYNHLLGTRAQELIAIGYDDPKALQESGASPLQVHAAARALHDAITADEFAIANLAFSKNKSPAEIIYGLAKQRGYVKAAGGDAPGGDKGRAAADILDTIERGQQSNKSLNGTGSTGGEQAMTAERLLAMPLDEFEAWTTKNPAAAKRIMGG